MKAPSIELLRIVGSRLGFGDARPEGRVAESREDKQAIDKQLAERPRIDAVPTLTPPSAPPSQPREWLTAASAGPSASLFKLANHIEGAQAGDFEPVVEPPPGSLTAPDQEQPTAAVPDRSPPLRAEVQGPSPPSAMRNDDIRVLAAGFPRAQQLRLDKVFEAESAEMLFLTREQVVQDAPIVGAFDLLLINVASMDVVKRNRQQIAGLLTCGVPALAVGSRSALDVLDLDIRSGDWDFLPSPWHAGELKWRSKGLLKRAGARHFESASMERQAPQPKLLRVAIAEHDPITRALIESALTQRGIECTAVDDGEAALALVEETRPDALIMDLALPNRDGFQLLADVKRSRELRATAVLVLTARQSEVDILRAFGLGADDYVTKPFSPLELVARIRRLTGGVTPVVEPE